MYVNEQKLGITGFSADGGGDPWFKAISQIQAPVQITPVQITPYIPTPPVFANVDNSAIYAVQPQVAPTTQKPDVSPPTGYLPAGIKAVNFTATPASKPDYVKLGLYAIGAIGALMLLTRKRKGH